MLLLPPQQLPFPFQQLSSPFYPVQLPNSLPNLGEGGLDQNGSQFDNSLSQLEHQLSNNRRASLSADDLQHMLPDQHTGGYMPSAGLQNKRQISDMNHNKAITKQLVSACHYQQVLDCVAQSIPIFDEVNVATALHRLARLQPPAANNRAGFIIQSKEFQLLVRAIRLHLPHFEAQAISNTMWAFATLSYFPQDNLLNEIASKAVSIMPSFRPQAVSNTLWAYAKLGYLPPQTLLQAVASQMHQDLPKSVPQDISNTLWAFATLRHHPGKELLEASSQQAMSMFHKFKPQEIANLLWSFATMEYNPPDPLLDAMATQMIARIQSFRPQAVSNSLWAYAKIGYNPGVMLLDITALKAATMFHQYTSQEVANTLWALAALDHYPGPEMLNAAAIQFAKRLEHFTPQDIASTLWAFAKLGHNACRGLLPSVALHVLKLWTRFTPTAIVTVLESLAILQGCPLHLWTQMLSKLFSLPVASLTADNLWHLYHTVLLLEAQGSTLGTASFQDYLPVDLLESARVSWTNSVQKKNDIDPLHQDISQHLWALGVPHSNNEIVADGRLNVDCLISGTNFVVIIDRTSDFTAACRSKLGASAAKVLILEGQNYRAISIPYYEWTQLTSSDVKGAYLLQKLQSMSDPRSQNSFHVQPVQGYQRHSMSGYGLPEMGGLGQSFHPLQHQANPLQASASLAGLMGYQQPSLLPMSGFQSQQYLSMAQLSNAISSMPLQLNTHQVSTQNSSLGPSSLPGSLRTANQATETLTLSPGGSANLGNVSTSESHELRRSEVAGSSVEVAASPSKSRSLPTSQSSVTNLVALMENLKTGGK